MRVVIIAVCMIFCMPKVQGFDIDTRLQSVTNPFNKEKSIKKVFQQGFSRIESLLREAPMTIVKVHRNLISWESFSLISGMFPFFIAARMADNQIQCCFTVKRIIKIAHKCLDGLSLQLNMELGFR